jgi:hypothetical protein
MILLKICFPGKDYSVSEFNTVKNHYMGHWGMFIKLFGAPCQWDSQSWEMLHKTFTKAAYRLTSRIGDVRPQMMNIFRNNTVAWRKFQLQNMDALKRAYELRPRSGISACLWADVVGSKVWCFSDKGNSFALRSITECRMLAVSGSNVLPDDLANMNLSQVKHNIWY